MEYEQKKTGHILNHGISGFHQYILTEPPRLSFVSQNLCAMLEMDRQELLEPQTDGYARHIHPGDLPQYRQFLEDLKSKAQTLSLEYRLIRKDGAILWVRDTATSYPYEDQMTADSILTDVTDLKEESQNLRFFRDTMSCGFLKFTCEKAPRVTYINEQMLRILGFNDGKNRTAHSLEMYKQNIFLAIPSEDRRRFSLYMERVRRYGGPVSGEVTILREDGSRRRLFGWVTCCLNSHGQEEFLGVCMDITHQQKAKEERLTRRYLQALAEVYDKIFSFDLARRTVTCLYGKNSPMFQWIENVPMQMEDATDRWVAATVCPEDRQRVLRFFQEFYRQKPTESESPPRQIHYRAISSDGTPKDYKGIFLSMDDSMVLFCCRNTPETESTALQSKYDSLQQVQNLVTHFTEGVVAFEVEADMVKPLYVSENVYSFFGYSREEWLSLADNPQSIRSFISKSGIPYQQIQNLFKQGEAEFSYLDVTQNVYRRIRAICSRKHLEGTAKTYVMLYNLDTKSGTDTFPAVRIRTFGYFDVFVDHRPIAFRNEKSKELLALLVDRRGGFVSSEEAISYLWEEEPVSSVTLARYRKVALRLKNLLEEYGIGQIVEAVNGKRRIVAEKVSCDLYDYLSGKEDQGQRFQGSYLSNYSWGESTLAQLTGSHLYAEAE